MLMGTFSVQLKLQIANIPSEYYPFRAGKASQTTSLLYNNNIKSSFCMQSTYSLSNCRIIRSVIDPMYLCGLELQLGVCYVK